MKLTVEIDPRSGFCGGVIRAIDGAQKFLEEHPGEPLYSLGAIVHNEEELGRLSSLGLKTVDKLEDAGKMVLVRAHGEPPSTYKKAEELGISIRDFTCPVVLNLQKSIREAYLRVKPAGGTVVIFGRIGHAEVLGLQGQADGDVVVVETVGMLSDSIRRGEVKLDKSIELYSQTTGNPSVFAEICEYLKSRVKTPSLLKIHNTICSQVSSRHSQLSLFASSHDVVIFISGRHSSNGKVLYELCRSINPRSYHISNAGEVEASWFKDGDIVGVCGATSTPRWLLQEIAAKILQLG